MVEFITGSRGERPQKRKPVTGEQHGDDNDNKLNILIILAHTFLTRLEVSRVAICVLVHQHNP
jgi:hypothetical protein